MPDNQGIKAFIACAIGATIGCLLMLQAGHNFLLAVLGLIAGGLVGYFSYQPTQVIRFIPKTFREALSVFMIIINMVSTICKITTDGIKKYIPRLCWASLAGLIVGISVNIIVLPISLLFKCKFEWDNPAWIIGIMFFTFFFTEISFIGNDRRSTTESITDFKKVIRIANPFNVMWFSIRYIIPKIIQSAFLLIVICVLGIALTPLFLYRFAKNLFLLIHSDIRLLCGIDAMIGTLVGYGFHSAVIGFFVGGFVGLANYEILSKRVLKLVPNTR